jgi:hypothetical protein
MAQIRSHRFAQCLLLAAALAPTAATAAEHKLEALARYGDPAASKEQVAGISQFSDLRPTDWAYQALSNLIERYGCVAGYANSSFKGGQSISRYEAAALLNACLDRVTDVTDELKKLIKEFDQEFALLRGRVDGLEARLGELEASRFSPTTKLSGLATFVVGANSFSGSAIDRGANSLRIRPDELASLSPSAVPLPNATSFNYDVQLTLNTSFNGNDLLSTVLRGGNFGSSVFGGDPDALRLSQLEIAFQEDAGPNVVGIDKLFYQFPLGAGFSATLGPRVGQENMLALWPSVYPADTILNALAVNGAPAAYNKNLGAGAGLWWRSNNFSISANYVAANGNDGDSAQGGIASKGSGATGTIQVGYGSQQWGLAAIWSYVQSRNASLPGATPFTHSAIDLNSEARTNAFGLSGYWQPQESGWVPSLSLGWGINSTSYGASQPAGSLANSQSWMAGLQWNDVLAKENNFGMAVGQPVYATSLTGSIAPDDGGLIWEWWYKFQVTDNITVTPALIYLSRPLGQTTPASESLSQFGGLIKTSFKF